MTEYLKIRDRKDLLKNSGSKAVLVVDSKSLDKYKEERERRMQISRIVEDNARLNKEVTDMRRDLTEILDLLRKKV